MHSQQAAEEPYEVEQRLSKLEQQVLALQNQTVSYSNLTTKQIIFTWLQTHKAVRADILAYESDGEFNTAAFRKTLSILCKQGILIRASFGLYVKNESISRSLYDLRRA